MKVFDSVSQWLSFRCGLKGSIGLVPTMGALHTGHASLLERSVRENEATVLTIYLNPTQFDDLSDLKNYPKTLQQDLAMARSLGVDYVITPRYEEIYNDEFRYRVEETEYSRELCGAHRNGHFSGVLTVVMKLLNIVQPRRAYFGEKDYQQYQLIRDMCAAFFMHVDIVVCGTVRENDGLAMSSRNKLLDASGRKKAALLNRWISCPRSDREVRLALEDAGFEVDYLTTRGNRRFAAVTIECSRPGDSLNQTRGNNVCVRLIDNALLSQPARLGKASSLAIS